MATTLIRNAQAIVTVDREDRVLRNGNILVEDRHHPIYCQIWYVQ